MLCFSAHVFVVQSPDAPSRFKAVSEAYEVLKDDAKRAAAAAEVEFGAAHTTGRRGFGNRGYAHDRAAKSAAHEALHKSLTW